MPEEVQERGALKGAVEFFGINRILELIEEEKKEIEEEKIILELKKGVDTQYEYGKTNLEIREATLEEVVLNAIEIRINSIKDEEVDLFKQEKMAEIKRLIAEKQEEIARKTKETNDLEAKARVPGYKITEEDKDNYFQLTTNINSIDNDIIELEKDKKEIEKTSKNEVQEYLRSLYFDAKGLDAVKQEEKTTILDFLQNFELDTREGIKIIQQLVDPVRKYGNCYRELEEIKDFPSHKQERQYLEYDYIHHQNWGYPNEDLFSLKNENGKIEISEESLKELEKQVEKYEGIPKIFLDPKCLDFIRKFIMPEKKELPRDRFDEKNIRGSEFIRLYDHSSSPVKNDELYKDFKNTLRSYQSIGPYNFLKHGEKERLRNKLEKMQKELNDKYRKWVKENFIDYLGSKRLENWMVYQYNTVRPNEFYPAGTKPDDVTNILKERITNNEALVRQLKIRIERKKECEEKLAGYCKEAYDITGTVRDDGRKLFGEIGLPVFPEESDIAIEIVKYIAKSQMQKKALNISNNSQANNLKRYDELSDGTKEQLIRLRQELNTIDSEIGTEYIPDGIKEGPTGPGGHSGP